MALSRLAILSLLILLIGVIRILFDRHNKLNHSPASDLQSSVFSNNNSTTTSESLEQIIARADEWIFHSFRNGMKIYKRKMPGTPLLAFRGDILLPYQMTEVVKVFFNVSHTLKWADKLQYVKTSPLNRQGTKDAACISPFHADFNQSTASQHDQVVKTLPKRTLFSKAKRIVAKFWNLILRVVRIKKHTRQTNSRMFPSQNCVDDLKTSLVQTVEDVVTTLLTSGSYSDIMYQLYAMWPLPPRDFVFLRKAQYDKLNQAITVHYSSTDDSRYPIRDGTVRTISPFTTWVFQDSAAFCAQNFDTDLCNSKSSNYSRTYLRLETFVQLEDMGLTWLVNYIQSTWPEVTIRRFLKVFNLAQI